MRRKTPLCPCSRWPGEAWKPGYRSSFCPSPLHAPAQLSISSLAREVLLWSWALEQTWTAIPGLWAVPASIKGGQSSRYTSRTSTNVCPPVNVKQKGAVLGSGITPYSAFMPGSAQHIHEGKKLTTTEIGKPVKMEQCPVPIPPPKAQSAGQTFMSLLSLWNLLFPSGTAHPGGFLFQ